jgi:hypothetical protein
MIRHGFNGIGLKTDAKKNPGVIRGFLNTIHQNKSEVINLI